MSSSLLNPLDTFHTFPWSLCNIWHFEPFIMSWNPPLLVSMTLISPFSCPSSYSFSDISRTSSFSLNSLIFDTPSYPWPSYYYHDWCPNLKFILEFSTKLQTYISSCLLAVSTLMLHRHLKLCLSKTEILFFPSQMCFCISSVLLVCGTLSTLLLKPGTWEESSTFPLHLLFKIFSSPSLSQPRELSPCFLSPRILLWTFCFLSVSLQPLYTAAKVML